MRKEWQRDNIIAKFSIKRLGFIFGFSVHPADPTEDISHICVKKPAVFLVTSTKDSVGVEYWSGTFLDASLSLARIKSYAQELLGYPGMRSWMREHKAGC